MNVFKITVCLPLLLLLLSSSAFSESKLPVVDLSNRTLGVDELVEIPNAWQFYWKEYVFEGDSMDGGKQVGKTLPWTTIPDETNGYPAHGYGTYALTIKLPKRTDNILALKLRRMKSAYAIYVDGVLLGHSGDLLDYPRALPLPLNDSGIVDFKVPIDKSEITVLIHITNMKYYRGGLDMPPILSYSSAAHTSKMREILGHHLLLVPCCLWVFIILRFGISVEQV